MVVWCDWVVSVIMRFSRSVKFVYSSNFVWLSCECSVYK